MNKIISLRGTNGSGKSTVVHKLLDLFGREPILGPDGKVWGYELTELRVPTRVVGRYETQCGGVDSFSKPGILPTVIEFICEQARHGSVVFEGVLEWSPDRYSQMERFMQENRLGYVIVGLLDTPLEVCRERVLKRQEERGRVRKLGPGIERKHGTHSRMCERIAERGTRVRTLAYQNAVPQLLGWLFEELRFPRTEGRTK